MTQQSSSRSGQFNTTTGAPQAGQDTTRGTMQEVADQAKETAGQVANQAQQKAGRVVDQTRQQMTSRLASQKDRAAEGLGSVAQALWQTGQQLREQDQDGVTSYIDNAASQVERFSTYLQNNDVGELINDVERFARRQPAVFLGGAFVLGLLGARFLKSSRQQLPMASEYPLAPRQDYSQMSGVYEQGYERAVGQGTAQYSVGDGTRRRTNLEDL